MWCSQPDAVEHFPDAAEKILGNIPAMKNWRRVSSSSSAPEP